MDTARNEHFAIVPEPTLEELIADPIIQMVMRSDDQTPADIRLQIARPAGGEPR